MSNTSRRQSLLSAAVISVMTSSCLFALPTLASVKRTSSASTDAIIGTGVQRSASTDAIIGTGKQKASTDAIIGTGKQRSASTDAIIGTGKQKASTDAIIGTGRQGYQNAAALVGPIVSFDSEARTITIHDRQLRISKDDATLELVAAGLASGNPIQATVVAALGKRGELMNPSLVVEKEPYVAGQSDVVVSGSVTSVDSFNGRAKIGSIEFDFTSALSTQEVEIVVGSIVQVMGTQPQYGQPVMANKVVVVAH
jgi:hypothetical protein